MKRERSMPESRQSQTIHVGLLLSLCMIALQAGSASAQLPSASPAVLSTGNNYTALARGFTAIGLNPAGLGMLDNPGFSLALVPVQIRLGVAPLTLTDILDVEGEVVPVATKTDWLNRITEAGGLNTRAGFDVTPLALTAGRVGFQVSTVGQASANLSPDALELVLFGNAGLNGTARDLTLAGTRVDGWAATTAAVSFGTPVGSVIGQNFAVGMTVKYTVGHVMALARDSGSIIRSSPVELDVSFPSIGSGDDLEADNGTGLGLDVGGAWENDKWAFGVAIQNVFNTFEWDLDGFIYRSGEAMVNDTLTALDDFDLEQPITNAPTALTEEALGQSFKPVFAVGAAYRATGKLTLMADARQDTGDALVTVEKSHLGVGLEFRPLGMLPLRGGISRVSGGGTQFSAGLGLILGPLNLSAGILTEAGSKGEYAVGTFALSFGHH